MADEQELLVVGRLVAAQGLRGELRVNPLSDFPERFTRPGPRWLQGRQGGPQAVTLLSGRQLPGKELFVIRLEGVNDRSGAEALVGQELLGVEPFHELVRLALAEGVSVRRATELHRRAFDLLAASRRTHVSLRSNAILKLGSGSLYSL